MTKIVVPYGAWRSPITADFLAVAGISLGYLQVDGENLYWVETRPLEEGRSVIVKQAPTGQITDVTPPDFNARTLVHEYGGGMYTVMDDVVYFSNYADQRLYRQAPGILPLPITPEPASPQSIRYADGCLTPDGRWLICVRESHHADQDVAQNVVNELVALPVDGSQAPHVIATGYDFYSSPCVRPDGRAVAWLCWNHPQMPWDGTELWQANLDQDATIQNLSLVAGGPAESIFQPAWRADGVLHFVSDRSNWWNLYRLVNGAVEAVAPMAAEFGKPQWVFGIRQYAFLNDGSIACVYGERGIDHLGLIPPGSYQVTPISCEYTNLDWLGSDGRRLCLIGGSPTNQSSVFTLDPGGAPTLVRSTLTAEIDETYIARPEPIEFPTQNQETAHAFYYAPINPLYVAPAGELPPLIVISHGGPTGATAAQLGLGIQFWTSRGFGVVDVNYGGSTGYGRAYRQRLNGAWGFVDVMDCINAARYLIAQGQADAKRVAIRGGSAGGYTTLRALTWQNFFAAGASYFGVADPEALALDTHKFESRYLDSLIGPYPAEKARYEERSPVNFVDQLNVPVILFQGLEDKVVPPAQAETMVAALQRNGLPHAYLAFAGEQHGFRKAENIIRCAEAELYFYGRIFHFTPADEIEPVEIANL